MIKDYLKENQPLFYRIIENEFNLKKIPHAFLLVGNNTDQPLQFLTMSLICNETLACEQCIDCKKVLNHQYADIIEIDGEEESIKKKHIENIQETFKKSSLEGKAKVYILKNVEKTTKEAMNALLKILEEPTEGIYAIFTTKNINRILPTIISRCQVIELKPDNKEVLKEKLIAKGYEEEKASVLSYIIKDEDDLEKLKIDYSLKEKMMKDIQKINQQLEKDEDTYQRYLDLYNLASGKNNARVSIERYVLATYFENMLIYANVIMKQLSQGRYQLLRKDDAGKGRSQQGLELDVFDQESGNIRSIKTLSGGESFKAALSLALGLSRMVQDYAGGIELNTLFIDEGFGSLDSQSLDQAMNCLMELHHENKLIGIISHVSDLKDRIERQLVVERKQKQSVIQTI